MQNLYPKLAEEWNQTKNGNLLPSMVRPGSHKKVWWQCQNGHEWMAVVKSRVSGCGCPYCTGHFVFPGETDLQTLYPELAKEWHPEKNGAFAPSDIRPGSNRKVWWKCKYGHEWQASIVSRVSGSGCPVCAGKIIIPKENDFASKHPDIAKEWHPTKNGSLKPSEVAESSNKKVWWKCAQGHEWQAAVAARSGGTDCPICANRKLLSGFNDLQTRFPEIAKEWDSQKNGITPDKVLPTRKKVWWLCPKGHSYEAVIATRVFRDTGCPICAGRVVVKGINDFEMLYPYIAKQWHPVKNGNLLPSMVTASSNKKVWWIDEFGHEWQASVSARVNNGTGCPYCTGRKVMVGFNDLASQAPDIAKEWNIALNGSGTPEMFTCGSNRKVWWQCSDGHIWQAPISRRYYLHTGCPVCKGNVSKKKLLQYERIMREIHSEGYEKK